MRRLLFILKVFVVTSLVAALGISILAVLVHFINSNEVYYAIGTGAVLVAFVFCLFIVVLGEL